MSMHPPFPAFRAVRAFRSLRALLRAARAGSAAAMPEPGAAPARPGRSRPCILLLEDEIGVRALLAEYLGRAGFLVLAGGSFREGREVLASRGWERIDLVITDSHLGRDPAIRDGLAFHAYWRALHPVPPFIFLCGWGDPDLPAAASCQVYGLAKPFPFPALLALVRAILDA